MRKHSLHGLTLLSAVVCVGSAVLVGRSFWRMDVLWVPLGQSTSKAYTLDGALVLRHGGAALPFSYFSGAVAQGRLHRAWLWRELSGIRGLGIGWGRSSGESVLILPLWLLPLLTAIAPVRWWRKRRKTRGRGFTVNAAAAK